MKKLDNFHDLFKNVSKPLILLPVFFCILSILMMFSTSYDNHIVFSRDVIVQSAAYLIGFVLIIIIASMDYSVFEEIERPLYIGSVVFLLLPYLHFIGL
nr:hypothetical protein [Bacillota bacterium]